MIEEFELDIERVAGASVFELHQAAPGALAGNLAGGDHGIPQNHVARQAILFDKREHHRGQAYFERGGKRAHVGVAQQQVQTAEPVVIRQRFVAGVDDGPVELHPLIDVVDDVIRALGELEIHARGRFGFVFERERIGLPHAARAGVNLPGRQERKEGAQARRRELHFAPHEVVFVAAKRGAGEVIDVVFNQRDPAFRPQRRDRALHHGIARKVERHHVAHAQAFRRGVFEMAHVHIHPPAVAKETSIAGRFLVIAVMQIDRSGPVLLE